MNEIHFNSFVDDEDWSDVTIACSPLSAKWQNLSSCLGLPLKEIREIKKTNGNDCVASLNDALMQWILQDYDTKKHGLPSWKSLIRAISRVDQDLCDKLAREHQMQGTYVHVLVSIVNVLLIILPYMED